MERLCRILKSALAIDPIRLDPGFKTKTGRIQLLYGAWVNLTQLAVGLSMGFAAVLIPQLKESDTEIQITQEDASWIVCVLPLSCPVGCIISGIAMDRYGRRIMLILSQIPMFTGWFYTGFASDSQAIIIGRAITGVGCGMAMGPSIAYCTEISLPNMRGVIGSFSNMAVCIGITMQAGLGVCIYWRNVCYTCSAVTFLCLCSFALLPETPYFVLLHKNEQAARNSLANFRGKHYNINREMAQLRDFKATSDLRTYICFEKIGLLCSNASCKPFWLMLIYVFLSQAVGNSFLLFWAKDFLTVTKSPLNPEIGNIVLGVTRMVTSIVTGALLYQIGRRPLAIISATGVTIVCFVLGVSLISPKASSLTPFISLILYMVFATLGYYILPILMAFEMHPLHIRGMLGSTIISLYCLGIFASTKMEPLVMNVLGLSNTFILFGSFSLLGIIFLYFYLPETKDLTLQEIEEYYKEIRATLISQRRIMAMSQMGILARAHMGKSRYRRSKSKKIDISKITAGVKPGVLAKLQEKKRLAEFASKTRMINDKNENDGTKLKDSTKTRTALNETADKKTKETKKQTKESKKNLSSIIQKSKDGDREPPKGKDQPSTSKKNT